MINPIYLFELSDDSIQLEDNLLRKQILRFGKWIHKNAIGGMLNVTKEYAEKIVKNFNNKAVENVYVPLGHTNDPLKNTGEVVELLKTKKGLDAIIKIKDKEILSKIKKGLIKGISASIDEDFIKKDTGKTVGPTLRHAALVLEPYIKGLQPFIHLEEENNKELIELTYSKSDQLTDINKSLDRLDEKLAAISLSDKVEPKKGTDKGASITGETIDLNEEKAKIKEKEVQLNEKEQALYEREATLLLQEADKAYNILLSEGKIVPAQQISFISLFNARNSIIELADGQSQSISEIFKEFCDRLPNIINFSEVGLSGVGDRKKTELTENEKAIWIEKLGMSEADALKTKKREAKNKPSGLIF
jgi:hypothetical protein